MSAWEFVVLVVMAGILGIITQSIFGFNVGGFFVSVFLGFIGGWLGNWVAGELALPHVVNIEIPGTGRFSIVWSIVGTLIVTCIVSWVQRSSYKQQAKKS